MQYRTKTVTVEAIQYTGLEDFEGIDRQYLGTDDMGRPVYQGVIHFHGGTETIRQGDWLVFGRAYSPDKFAAFFEEVVPPAVLEPTIQVTATLEGQKYEVVPIADAPATTDEYAL